MDPNANLKELLELAEAHTEHGDLPAESTNDLVSHITGLESDLERMSELLLALDGWIDKGGFLPDRWHKPVRGLKES